MTATNEIRDNLERIRCIDLARIAAEYRVKLDDMLGRRNKTATLARHRLWAIMQSTLGLSSQELGDIFGADHSTILCGVRKAHERLAKEHAA